MEHLSKGYDHSSSGNVLQLLLAEISGKKQKAPIDSQ